MLLNVRLLNVLIIITKNAKEDARKVTFDQWITCLHEPSKGIISLKWIRLLCEGENRSNKYSKNIPKTVYMLNIAVLLLKHCSRSVLRWKMCVWMQSSSLRDWPTLRDAVESINSKTETHRLQIFHLVWNHRSNIQHDRRQETCVFDRLNEFDGIAVLICGLH